MHKLCCYVEESGQDSKGRIFVVSLVIVGENRDTLEWLCEHYEAVSQKGKQKWHGSMPKRRLEYMRLVISDSRFIGALCYMASQAVSKPDYDAETVSAIVCGIHNKLGDARCVTDIWIDGLSIAKQREYSIQLRNHGLRPAHIHRVRKEACNTFIRLADALAGLVRDAIEGSSKEAVNLVKQGKRNGAIVEL